MIIETVKEVKVFERKPESPGSRTRTDRRLHNATRSVASIEWQGANWCWRQNPLRKFKIRRKCLDVVKKKEACFTCVYSDGVLFRWHSFTSRDLLRNDMKRNDARKPRRGGLAVSSGQLWNSQVFTLTPSCCAHAVLRSSSLILFLEEECGWPLDDD